MLPDTAFDALLASLDVLEAQCTHSTLTLYPPEDALRVRFDALLAAYSAAAFAERARLRAAVRGKVGILNQLLGTVYEAAQRVCGGATEADVAWVRRGLAAATLEGGSFDFRDSLVALAELYVLAEAARIGAQAEFAAHAAWLDEGAPEGGRVELSAVLAGFAESPVVAGRRKRGVRG